MDRFKVGQVVRVSKHKELARIMTKCNGWGSTWCVVYRKKQNNEYVVDFVEESNIENYTNICWNKNCQKKLDSDLHETCAKCGWIVCPKCKLLDGVCQ